MSMRCGVYNCVSVINCSNYKFVSEAFDVHIIIIIMIIIFCLFVLCVVANIEKNLFECTVIIP
jgi:hypothetical protein